MLNPFTSISCFWDLVKFLNFGMKCSTRSNKIWRSLEYKKQSIKKCCDDSFLKWQLHSADSDWPIENLCKFSSDLSNLILVSKVFPIFEPLEKCLYFLGLSSSFILILNSGNANSWVPTSKLFHRFVINGKNTAKRNMSSAVCASSMYSRLCMKMSSFLFVRACAVPRMLYLSCGIPFPV